MISRGFQNLAHHQGIQMFPVTEDLVSANSVEVVVNSGSGSSSGSSSSSSSHSSTLLFNLSILKDKLSQVQTLVDVILSPDRNLPESTSMAVSSMNSTIQEIIVTASSMMFTCQQMALSFPTPPPGTNELHHQQSEQHEKLNHHSSPSNYGNNNRVVLTSISTEHNNIRGQGFFTSTESEALDWFGETYNNNNSNSINCKLKGYDNIDKSVAISDSKITPPRDDTENNVNEGFEGNIISSNSSYDIVELDATDLLAKYTHYCQVCGKGFKRDANLRMHMRAHGDEYKTSAALSNPLKQIGSGGDECLMMSEMKPKKYSCPQEGCRWNKKHAKFQPLKSMICAKNHYKRSHCPKMYVCKRCNQKQFSVLSDLRTHEKHCGDLKWQCSCGTTFSRKDKLMGHVALFVGHRPASTNAILTCAAGKLEPQGGLQLLMDAT